MVQSRQQPPPPKSSEAYGPPPRPPKFNPSQQVRLKNTLRPALTHPDSDSEKNFPGGDLLSVSSVTESFSFTTYLYAFVFF